MSSDDQTVTAPDGGTDPAPSGSTDDRLDALTDRVDKLAQAVAAMVPGSHAAAQQRTEDRLDRPSSVEDQVAAALQQADADRAEQERRARIDGDLTQVKTDLAQLREQPPRPPVPRRRTFLGWGHE
jgi:hypothetical protein